MGTSADPQAHLDARTLLGGMRGQGREIFGHMYASHVAGLLAQRDPHDRRTLILGLGFRGGGYEGFGSRSTGETEAQAQELGEQRLNTARGSHFDMLELLQKLMT